MSEDKGDALQVKTINHIFHSNPIKNFRPKTKVRKMSCTWTNLKLSVGEMSMARRGVGRMIWCRPSTPTPTLSLSIVVELVDDGDVLLRTTHFESRISFGEEWPPSRILSMALVPAHKNGSVSTTFAQLRKNDVQFSSRIMVMTSRRRHLSNRQLKTQTLSLPNQKKP